MNKTENELDSLYHELSYIYKCIEEEDMFVQEHAKLGTLFLHIDTSAYIEYINRSKARHKRIKEINSKIEYVLTHSDILEYLYNYDTMK